MNDPTAAAVQGLVVFVGFVLSLGIGWVRRGPRTFGRVLSSAGLAILLGLLMTFVAVFFNGLCITRWQLCQDHGDGNMAYWFFPFFAIPLYGLLMLVFGSREEPLTLIASTFDAAVDAALGQLHRGQVISQRCPGCQSVLVVENVATDAGHTGTGTGSRIRLRCACSKCDRLFIMQAGSAA